MSAPGNSTTAFSLQENGNNESWYVYIVRCRDNSLYTGITKDLKKRIFEHNSGANGARYTRSRRPVALVYSEQASSRSVAASRECHIKKLNTLQKHQLVKHP
jgi:putative endonuclease